MTEPISNNKIRVQQFHCTKRFKDDLGAMNDGGEFGITNAEIYPKELEHNPEHQVTHASFLTLLLT